MDFYGNENRDLILLVTNNLRGSEKFLAFKLYSKFYPWRSRTELAPIESIHTVFLRRGKKHVRVELENNYISLICKLSFSKEGLYLNSAILQLQLCLGYCVPGFRRGAQKTNYWLKPNYPKNFLSYFFKLRRIRQFSAEASARTPEKMAYADYFPLQSHWAEKCAYAKFWLTIWMEWHPPTFGLRSVSR